MAPAGAPSSFWSQVSRSVPVSLVNGVLKEISHRPRPEEHSISAVAWSFEPYDSFAGQCGHNCSFVSGEAATAAWTLAPALLARRRSWILAIAAALLFTLATGGLADGLRRPSFSDVSIRGAFHLLSSSSRFTDGIVAANKQGIETPWVFSPERSTTPPFSCAGPMWSRRFSGVGSAFALLKLDLAMKLRAHDPTPQTLFLNAGVGSRLTRAVDADASERC